MCETSASRGQILTKQQLMELNNESLRVQNGIALLKFCWSREKIKQKFDARELRVRFQTAFYKYSNLLSFRLFWKWRKLSATFGVPLPRMSRKNGKCWRIKLRVGRSLEFHWQKGRRSWRQWTWVMVIGISVQMVMFMQLESVEELCRYHIISISNFLIICLDGDVFVCGRLVLIINKKSMNHFL